MVDCGCQNMGIKQIKADQPQELKNITQTHVNTEQLTGHTLLSAGGNL